MHYSQRYIITILYYTYPKLSLVKIKKKQNRIIISLRNPIMSIPYTYIYTHYNSIIICIYETKRLTHALTVLKPPSPKKSGKSEKGFRAS